MKIEMDKYEIIQLIKQRVELLSLSHVTGDFVGTLMGLERLVFALHEIGNDEMLSLLNKREEELRSRRP